MTATPAASHPEQQRRSRQLEVQQERECVICGRRFDSLRPSHRHCDPACKALGHELATILAGKSRHYRSIAARLGAKSAVTGTAIGRTLAEVDRRRAERAEQREAGDLPGRVRSVEENTHARRRARVDDARPGARMMYLVPARTDRLRPPRLSQRQREALTLIEGMPGALTVAGLAEAMGRPYANTQKMVRGLEKRGLAVREPAEER